jgi:hypothetical protein
MKKNANYLSQVEPQGTCSVHVSVESEKCHHQPCFFIRTSTQTERVRLFSPQQMRPTIVNNIESHKLQCTPRQTQWYKLTSNTST